jgi:protein TonB
MPGPHPFRVTILPQACGKSPKSLYFSDVPMSRIAFIPWKHPIGINGRGLHALLASCFLHYLAFALLVVAFMYRPVTPLAARHPAPLPAAISLRLTAFELPPPLPIVPPPVPLKLPVIPPVVVPHKVAKIHAHKIRTVRAKVPHLLSASTVKKALPRALPVAQPPPPRAQFVAQPAPPRALPTAQPAPPRAQFVAQPLPVRAVALPKAIVAPVPKIVLPVVPVTPSPSPRAVAVLPPPPPRAQSIEAPPSPVPEAVNVPAPVPQEVAVASPVPAMVAPPAPAPVVPPKSSAIFPPVETIAPAVPTAPTAPVAAMTPPALAGPSQPAVVHLSSIDEMGETAMPHPGYPYSALNRGETGTVIVNVLFDAKGKVARVDIQQSSGAPDLDSVTRSFILKHWRVPALAGEIAIVPVVYRLKTP